MPAYTGITFNLPEGANIEASDPNNKKFTIWLHDTNRVDATADIQALGEKFELSDKFTADFHDRIIEMANEYLTLQLLLDSIQKD